MYLYVSHANENYYGNFSITAGKPADVELGRGLSREQRSGLTKE
jgi:hypothetical protein